MGLRLNESLTFILEATLYELVEYGRVRRQSYEACYIRRIIDLQTQNTRNVVRACTSYFCRTYYFIISEYSYCTSTMLYRRLHRNGLTSFSLAHELLLFRSQIRKHLLFTNLNVAILISKYLEFRNFRNAEPTPLFSLFYTARKLNISWYTVAFQNVFYSYF